MKHFVALLTILALAAVMNPALAQVTQNEAVEGLLYLFNEHPRAVAQFLVASATPDTTEGKAFRLVMKRLLEREAAVRLAETRSRLTEDDRAILKAVKQDAVFDPAKVFPERIEEPTKELKLDTVSEVSKE